VRGRIFEDEFGYEDAGIRPDGDLNSAGGIEDQPAQVPEAIRNRPGLANLPRPREAPFREGLPVFRRPRNGVVMVA
jgi:hypothetical protein